jgi:manganese transport protein
MGKLLTKMNLRSLSPEPSLPGVHRSVKIANGNIFRKFLSFAGPAYLVSVGYMDPGNWATDLAGGSRYGYALLWVISLSSLMAIVLQTLCARLGIATGRDLAQACRDCYPKPIAIALWLLCEVAIIACDVAEVIGSAVALKLLIGLPLVWGVLLTGFDVLALLALMHFGFRKIEAIILTLVGTIAGCFAINVFLAKPDLLAVAQGMVTPSLPDASALAIAVGILGATVMPHNLYLHSSLVQTRSFDQNETGMRQAIKMSTIDTVVALGLAFFVNAAILILAASVFHGAGTVVEELQQAHELLKPTLGGLAATLFAVALLASGQSSTITATLAGQIVMEGFISFKVAPWIRRLITRLLAIVPAALLVAGSGEHRTNDLLVLTQIVLSMQLPFAIFPLIAMTSDRKTMGPFTNPTWLRAIAYLIATIITVLNVKLLIDSIGAIWVSAIAIGMLLFWLSARRGKIESAPPSPEPS